MLSFVYDLTAPTVTITTASDTINVNPVPFTFTFNEPIQALVADSITVSGGTVAEVTTVDNLTFTVNVTPNPRTNTNSTLGTSLNIELEEGKVLDASGNGNDASANLTVVYDGYRPVVGLFNKNSKPITLATEDFLAFILISEPTNELELADIIVTNGSASNLRDSSFFSVVDFSANEGSDVVTISIAENTIIDAAGNGNEAVEYNVTIDRAVPTVEITSTLTSPTNQSPIPLTFTFGEKVVLRKDTLSISGPFKPFAGWSTVDSLVYNTMVIDTTGSEGRLSLILPEGAFEDLAGNGNQASETFRLTYDAVVPTAFITAPVAVNSTTTFNVYVGFRETSVVGFDISKIQISNGTVDTIQDQNPGFFLRVTPTGEGDISLTIDDFSDAAGNKNTLPVTQIIKYDIVSPTVKISGFPNAVSNADPIMLTFDFNEKVTDFTLEKIEVTNATKDKFQILDDSTYTVEITPITEGGISIGLAAGSFTDSAGNKNTKSASVNFTFSNPPTLTINVPSEVRNSQPFSVSITFNKSVTGLAANDFTTVNASLSSLTGAGTSYNVMLTPTACGDAEIFLTLVASAITDGFGNTNVATTSSAISFIPQYSQGEAEPIKIATPADFKLFVCSSGDHGKKFIQTANINLEGASIGQIASFTGTYDGGGFKIENFKKTNALFNTIGSDAEVKNLRIEQSYGGVEDKFSVLVQTLEGTLSNCSVNATVSYFSDNIFASNVEAAGLVFTVGVNGKVNLCSTEGNITLNSRAGSYASGLVFINHGLIDESFSLMTLNTTADSFSFASGLVNSNQSTGKITRSYTSCSITNATTSGSFAYVFLNSAGLVRVNTGSIENSYSTCSISGLSASGLVQTNSGTSQKLHLCWKSILSISKYFNNR